MTETGVMVGTIDYMAPEQIAGAPVDARADIYSLGCVLYQALTGQVPYPRASNVAKMFAHTGEPPPSVLEAAPEVPPRFEGIVQRAMAKDRDDRYLSAGDLGRAATAAAEGTSVATPERTVAVGAAAPGAFEAERGSTGVAARPAAAAPRRRRARRLGAALAALAALGVAALVLAVGGGGPEALSKIRYQDEVLDATRPLDAEIFQLNDRLPAHLNRDEDAVRAAAELSRIRTIVDETIADLERFTPPADVEDLHARIIEVYRRIRGTFADAGAAADLGNDRIYRRAPRELDKHARALDALGPEFKSKGYSRLSLQPD